MNRSETSRRGWIFQERLLSNRTLHIGSGQWYWQCDMAWSPERKPDLSSQGTSGATSRAARRYLKDGAAESTSLWNRTDTWHQTVESYSKTLLTFDKDKLIAMAGVAKQYAHPELGAYCAGLWENSMLYNLTWQCHRSSFRPLDTSTTTDETRRAPTWSWASVSKSVSFGSRTLYESEAEWQNSGDKVLDFVDIHSVSTAPLAGNVFGEVIGGELELTGWLLRQGPNHVTGSTSSNHSPDPGKEKTGKDFSFFLEQGNSHDHYDDIPHRTFLFDSDIPYSDNVVASFDRGVPPPGEVYLLPLYWVSSWGSSPDGDDEGNAINLQNDNRAEPTIEPIQNPDGWIFLLALLLRPLDRNSDETSPTVPRYERVGAVNDWVDPSDSDFGASVTSALGIYWDPLEKQAKPGTKRQKTRICIT